MLKIRIHKYFLNGSKMTQSDSEVIFLGWQESDLKVTHK